MDLGGAGTGGAVACPVCTLYLREGISLQRHLDTHPKEQVIEALIKASATVPPLTQPPSPTITPPQTNPQVPTTGTHIPSQSQYPIGPVFECPPMGTMVPPQFASFSYQQFVNNGTMMIPQYAMAPQANQMMQMLYNPYGMYQQQQIPTVQMISPITTIPTTTRIRPAVSVAGEINEPEPEADRVLTDIDVPETSSEEQTQDRHEIFDGNGIHVEHRGQQTQNSTSQEQHSNQHEYQSVTQSLTIACESSTSEEEKSQCVLPDVDEGDNSNIVPDQMKCKTIEYEESESQQYSQGYEKNVTKENENDVTLVEVNIQIEEEKLDSEQALENDEQNVNEPTQAEAALDKEMKESSQPEVEQLERLLITIMESEFSSVQMKESNEQRERKNSEERMIIERENTVIRDTITVDTDIEECSETTPSAIHQEDNSCKDIEEANEQSPLKNCTYSLEENLSYIYRYKHSLSAPASPVLPKKSHRTYSMHSDFGSLENLSIYPGGFDASNLQDDEDEDDEEKNDMEDNFDEEDMDIEEIPSPHTPFTKNDITDCTRSHTPLSTISGISVLRVRTDLSKPSSPASTHSFYHMDADSLSNDADSNDDTELSPEKDLIDCSQVLQDSKSIHQEVIVTDSLEKKSDSNHTYHQSVITEHVSSFPVIHSQQPIIIHETYSMSNNKTTNNLLNLSEPTDPMTSTDSKIYQPSKSILQKPTTELLNINEDAHAGPMNVFEFDGLQILVPSTFISESSQKAVSATSQQSIASSEGGAGIDEEVKSVNMRADETMPPRGELSEQESNGCTEHSAWQLYMSQESSRMSTSYDLMARESWEESEGSDNEISGPLLDSRSLATHFTSSLFLDRDRKTPTKRTFKCPHCNEVFDCPKERRVHSTTVHKEPGPSGSRDNTEQPEVKDIKLLDGRMNMFDAFVPGLHVQQSYHQQPLLHQLQPPTQQQDISRVESDQKIDNLTIPPAIDACCSICNQRFSSEKSLQIHHRRMHVTEVTKRRENAKCQICNEEFPSVVLFNSHLKIHPLECGQCGKYFYRKQNFKLHMKRHLGIKPFPCTVCDKAFLTKQKLDEHTNGHTGNAPVKCNLCNETFRRYSNLTQHKNRHHLNIKKKLKDYICHCGEVFHTKKKLAWHKETHDEKPKACTYCNERFIHMASLTRHMRRAHNRRFVPDAQRESENVECPICKCIYLRSSLAVHMRVHNGERPYECQVCSKAFSTKWNLQLHKWTHAARSTKPFKCNQCSAAFYRHSDYTAHMNSHRNVRPYTCNYCGAQFIRKYNCLRHVKEHEENKAYTCDVCNKTFHRSYYLKEHLRVHSGARPYSCHICGKSSSTKSNHNKHVRIHHAREPVNTEN
ncbi:uncharacterized protein LOC107273006 isoform X2 [Cephus cinctus]|uniref:Uncharacterized protein LOC107273006 isoform X2 n=1 Tax=Cephus cinctus TaxID=211228 RepID=A0AAJ7RT46_CEPCN|nr:uncharacterized protein LOC107273006 isoform X2 [Cephus cinctus]